MYFISTIRIIMCAVYVALTVVSNAEKKAERFQIPEENINALVRREAMPELGDGRLAYILSKYYKVGLGGPKNWEKITSVILSGRIKHKSEEFEVNFYKKKPNLAKTKISREGRNVVLSYDGKTAWKRTPSGGEELMSDLEARLFIHEAHFGNYMLYPLAKGKEVTYIDTMPVEGNVCHQIRVTLDSGFQVDYFIDIRTYLDTKVVITDQRTGTINTVIYTDYTRELGLPIARRIEGFENGEWVSLLVVEEAKVNLGLVPWMFEMRSQKSP